jgi:hypothetical protein
LVLIKQRVQFGMNLAGGAAVHASGTVTRTSTTTYTTFDPATRRISMSADRTTTVFDGPGFLEDLGLPRVLPVGKVELAIAGVVTRNVKIRASGGVNLPGMQSFSLTGIYFFGR